MSGESDGHISALTVSRISFPPSTSTSCLDLNKSRPNEVGCSLENVNKKPAKSGTMASRATGYPGLLAEIKQRIRAAQVGAAMAANSGMLVLYWEIGEELATRQAKEGWGAAILPKLEADLQNELPEVKGFSARNMRRMIQFHGEYPELFPIWPQAVAKSRLPGNEAAIGQPAVAQLTGGAPDGPIWPQPVAKLKNRPSPARKEPLPEAQSPAASGDAEIWQRAVAKLTWAHNIILIEKVKDLPTRLWYAQQAFAQGWSRNVLSLQIQSQAHARQGNAITNFPQTLPPPQSDLATQLLKDPYLFDFLTLEKPFHERELETGLLRHLQDFLVELGAGFAFVGRQVHMEVGDDDFYLDLLFYHLKLRCFVVIDLKTGPFKAEYAGKMNFYLNATDDRLRHAGDQPSVGLILCQDKNRVVAEYALRGIKKAIGVSEYQLTRALPKKLQSALPSITQIETELSEAGARRRTIKNRS
jgi:predicted nuclease of restriction endonuclease-like (RecB) superfamily